MSNNIQKITRASLGRTEAAFITQIGKKRFFSIEDARKILRHEKNDPTSQFLERLRRKGWILSMKRGLYATIPLSAGGEANPQIHEFLIAMQLVNPAAIAYCTALNHHGMSEQLPRTVYVATNHPVRYPSKVVLWLTYKIVSLRAPRYFGIMKDWIDDGQFYITDKEKTIVDGLDLPEYVGGVGEIAKALRSSWKNLDTEKLFRYAVQMGNVAVVKRLGFLMENLKLGDAEPLRKRVQHAKGFSPLDPLLPRTGKHSRRWGLLVNVGDIG
jgi:predicted transcriptional regulator of viral defense system